MKFITLTSYMTGKKIHINIAFIVELQEMDNCQGTRVVLNTSSNTARIVKESVEDILSLTESIYAPKEDTEVGYREYEDLLKPKYRV